MTQASRPTPAAPGPGRRSVVGGLLGLTGAAVAAPLLTACGGGPAADPKTVTFGSNGADTAPKAAYAGVTTSFTRDSGLKVATNTVDHDTFQKSITSYLQGTPDDVFTWFAGYRMQYFAKKGLASPVDEVWETIGAGFSDATKQLSRGEDGKYYFVPLYNYPWAVFYRKSLFAERGYEAPRTWDEFIALAKRMRGDGLDPVASGYGGGDAWSVLGAFDWRHTGYIMILYLAGLKSFDPALKEAAALDGASGRQTFFRITLPALKPVNVIIVVVTVMESLRAFDIVYVLGGGTGSKPGMELLSLLITDNIVGESGHIGYGSALAVLLLLVSLAAIGAFLVQTFRKEDA
ncbi:extracellular solute-binding protein [Streptomyces sp. CRN 30]|uniref:extracellular solute-binding protein n=1 Tax=Streptomyces sp. CRN 30 TaxID=3075613 RepID=UPI002A83FE77|nr:extracellular solute-binding protein [Streptomyces sp. CRN 30]